MTTSISTRRRAVKLMYMRGMTVRDIVACLADARIINSDTGKPWSIGTVQSDLKYICSKAISLIENTVRVSFERGDINMALRAIRHPLYESFINHELIIKRKVEHKRKKCIEKTNEDRLEIDRITEQLNKVLNHERKSA